eukprot:308811-Pelagomonas_calceolata.AAC.2
MQCPSPCLRALLLTSNTCCKKGPAGQPRCRRSNLCLGAPCSVLQITRYKRQAHLLQVGPAEEPRRGAHHFVSGHCLRGAEESSRRGRHALGKWAGGQ